LGDGTTDSKSTPFEVMTDVATMAAGSYVSMFLKTDGSVQASGMNFVGNLGGGERNNPLSPIPVLSGVEIRATSWAGFDIEPDGSSVFTGDFLGWIDITADPFVYSYSLGNYIYLPEASVLDAGAWVWVPK